MHGKNRLASNSLLESLVFAKNAALHIITVDEEDRKNPHAPRFAEYVDLSIKELAAFYQLSLEEYDDLDVFYQNNKEKIWEEIRRLDNMKGMVE